MHTYTSLFLLLYDTCLLPRVLVLPVLNVVHACVYVHVFVCVRVCVRARARVCVYVCVVVTQAQPIFQSFTSAHKKHVCVCACVRVCVCTCVCVCACVVVTQAENRSTLRERLCTHNFRSIALRCLCAQVKVTLFQVKEDGNVTLMTQLERCTWVQNSTPSQPLTVMVSTPINT